MSKFSKTLKLISNQNISKISKIILSSVTFIIYNEESQLIDNLKEVKVKRDIGTNKTNIGYGHLIYPNFHNDIHMYKRYKKEMKSFVDDYSAEISDTLKEFGVDRFKEYWDRHEFAIEKLLFFKFFKEADLTKIGGAYKTIVKRHKLLIKQYGLDKLDLESDPFLDKKNNIKTDTLINFFDYLEIETEEDIQNRLVGDESEIVTDKQIKEEQFFAAYKKDDDDIFINSKFGLLMTIYDIMFALIYLKKRNNDKYYSKIINGEQLVSLSLTMVIIDIIYQFGFTIFSRNFGKSNYNKKYIEDNIMVAVNYYYNSQKIWNGYGRRSAKRDKLVKALKDTLLAIQKIRKKKQERK